MSRGLRLRAGDVLPVHGARASRTVLRITPGEIAVLTDGTVSRRWDVADCRLSGPHGALAYLVDFVAPDGATRCTLDLVTWTPGTGDVPPNEWATLGGPLARIRAAVVHAADVGEHKASGRPSDRHDLATPAAQLATPVQMGTGLAFVALFAAGDWLGLTEQQPQLMLGAGVVATALAFLAASPRSWWPVPRLRFLREAELADGLGGRLAVLDAEEPALVLMSERDMWRYFPLGDGPTAVTHASVLSSENRLLLWTRVGTVVAARLGADAARGVAALLEVSGVPVTSERSSAGSRPSPRPSGGFGDALPSTGLGLALIFTMGALLAGVHGYYPAVVAHLCAVLVSLAGAGSAWRYQRAIDSSKPAA